MADEIIKRDENRVTVLAGITDDASQEVRMLRVDPVTGRLKLSMSGIAASATVDVGTTSTLVPGSSATATNSGTTSAAIIDFGIPAGSVIYSTFGIPAVGVGVDGDWAFDTSVLAEVYYKTGGAWTTVNSLQGPAGANGATGPTGPIGITWRGAYNNSTAYVLNDGVYYATTGSSYINIQAGTGNLPTDTSFWNLIAQKGADGAGSGTVTSVSVTSANGLAGTVATATTTPAITLSTSVTGIVKGNGTALSAATDGTDYLSSTTGLKLDQATPQTVQGRPVFDDGIQLGLTPTVGATEIGKMYWDVDWKTPIVELEDDVHLQVGQETMAYVYNGTAGTLNQGNVVYTSGAQSGVPSVSLAQGDIDATSSVLGVVTSTTIAPTEYGYVTIRGHVNNVDTSAWSVGDVLYLDAATAGMLTNIKPNTGDYDTIVAKVMIVDASTGRIYVNISKEYKTGVISGGSGVDFFLDDTTIIATSANNTYPVKTLLKVPNTSAEDVDTIAVTAATSPVLYGEYLWQTGLGDTSIQGGVWNFDIYAGVSSATNTTSLTQNIYRSRPEAGTVTIDNVVGTSARATASTGTPFDITKIDASAVRTDCSYLMITNNTTGLYPITARTSDTVVTITVPAGYTPAAASTFQVQKKLFGVSTGEMNNVATAPLFAGLQLYSITTVQPAYTILATDQLGTKMFGISDGTRNVYFSHNGTTRYSHFTSPLVVRHNDLAGLQGGATGEYYHLTSAQHTLASAIPAVGTAGNVMTSAGGIWTSAAPTGGSGAGNSYAWFIY